MKILFTLLFFISSGAWATVDDCKEGFESFEKTLYPVIQNYCAGCHGGGNVKAPPFAVKDAFTSYNHVLSYMNFSDLDKSLLVIRSGNFHCGEENCEFESYDAVSAAAKEWWDKGENRCFRNGRHFTREVMVPKVLPKQGEGFIQMEFPLDNLSAKFNGASIVLDIQEFYPASETTRGAFLIKAPRVINGRGGIYIQDLKVLLNGKYDHIYNQFTNVDNVYNYISVSGMTGVRRATPVLSSRSMILLKDSLEETKLSISFVNIKDSNEVNCMMAGKFRPVHDVLRSNSCTQCHDGRGNDLGTKVANFSQGSSMNCQLATQLIDPLNLPLSPLLSLPEKGVNDHPQMASEVNSELLSAVRQWLSQ